MKFCAELMNDVSDIEVDRAKVRAALRMLGTSFMSIRGWEELTSHWNTAIGEIRLSAALFYLLEAAIPMVTAFCSALHRTSGVGRVHKPVERDSSVSESVWIFCSALQVTSIKNGC